MTRRAPRHGWRSRRRSRFRKDPAGQPQAFVIEGRPAGVPKGGADEGGDLRTHRLPLEEAPHGYDIFQRKDDGAIKVVLEP